MAMIATREELGSFSGWRDAFSGERKDWRYYEIVNDTLSEPAAEFLYMVLPSGALQPLFVIDQDLLAGSGATVQSTARAIRRVWPRLLKMRTLMIGCAAGEGHLAATAEDLTEMLPKLAKEKRASLIVMKEFPSRYRPALEPLRRQGFTRVPSMPMTRLNIMYDNFDDFVARKLSKPTRKSLRRKLRAADRAEPHIELQVVDDVSPYIDEIYPLYLAVYERSPLHFEKLTKEFLRALGARMPDKARFFIWRQSGKAIAFSLCLIHGDTIYDEYLGLDYRVAFDLHLYFYTLRDIINWAIEHRLQWYVSSALNYEPKLHLRCELVPLDLYVKHASPLINAVMKRVLPLLEPTRNDPVLHRFPNFREVWSE
jgi:peptidoglycan biosynthesis/recognition FemAB-like protein